MFCSYCGQAAAADASSCANCGKPLCSPSAQNPALVAFAVIFAITTIVAGWTAVYFAREAAQARQAMAMVSQSREMLPPQPPPAPNAEQPSDSGVVGGVPGGVAGGVTGQFPPRAAAPSRVRMPAGVAQAHLISRTPPVYPPLAKAAHVQGLVILRAILDKEGKVADLRVVSGHPMLVQAALDAVRHWRYDPYFLNGKPVEVETQITVRFKLAP